MSDFSNEDLPDIDWGEMIPAYGQLLKAYQGLITYNSDAEVVVFHADPVAYGDALEAFADARQAVQDEVGLLGVKTMCDFARSSVIEELLARALGVVDGEEGLQ